MTSPYLLLCRAPKLDVRTKGRHFQERVRNFPHIQAFQAPSKEDEGAGLTESDEELPVSFPLVGREGKDARQVVALLRMLLLQSDQRTDRQPQLCFLKDRLSVSSDSQEDLF